VTGLPIDAALDVARAMAIRPPPEAVPLEAAAGRRLAADLRALVDLPTFDQSAMDGWAVRAAETPGRLRVEGESAAGVPAPAPLAAGRAARVSTGAPLPPAADAVVRAEDAREEGDALVVPTAVPRGRDVRLRGEVIGRGGTLVPEGAVLAPHAVAAAGAVGVADVRVDGQIRVAILASGRELVPLGEPLPPGGVYDASRVGLAAQVEACGARVVAHETVGDDAAATRAAIERLLEGAAGGRPHLLVTAGGLGRGRHDHVRAALDATGFRTLVDGLALSPLHPTWLGARRDQLALGLPGNAVSAAVALHLLGRPLLGREAAWGRAPLALDPGRSRGPAVVGCAEEDGRLVPLPDRRSHAVTALVGATALALLPASGPGSDVPFVRLSAPTLALWTTGR